MPGYNDDRDIFLGCAGFQIVNDHAARCDGQAGDCSDCLTCVTIKLAGADGDGSQVFGATLQAWSRGAWF